MKQTVMVYDTDDKKTLHSLCLSPDFAIESEFDKADKELTEALELDKDHNDSTYFASGVDSIENLCRVSAPAKQWLEAHKARLGG